jgi:hypothetical protein
VRAGGTPHPETKKQGNALLAKLIRQHIHEVDISSLIRFMKAGVRTC